MVMKNLFIGCMAAVAAVAGLSGCDEKRVSYSGPDYLMFSDTIYNYPVQESGETFKVPVSATVKSDRDRTFAVEVIDSKSNAVEGKHYRLLDNNVTIKAGEMAGYVEVKGIYENIGISDSLGFALRLIVPDEYKWDLYGTDANVVLQKVCPFDINAFSGYCLVTSLYFLDYSSTVNNTQGLTSRLIKTEVSPDEENTVILHGPYYEGYDVKLKFKTDDVAEPYIEMDDTQCGITGEAFNTVYGDGKLMMTQPSGYVSYYSSCENFVMQYVSVQVFNKDGSLYGTVGTYATIYEWISDGEAEDLMEDGY